MTSITKQVKKVAGQQSKKDGWGREHTQVKQPKNCMHIYNYVLSLKQNLFIKEKKNKAK